VQAQAAQLPEDGGDPVSQRTGERAAGQAASGAPVGRAESISQLDDPAFLEERRHVREALEHTPQDAVGRAELAALHDALTEEFERRARAAWGSR
jgi:hypothetical protein